VVTHSKTYVAKLAQNLSKAFQSQKRATHAFYANFVDIWKQLLAESLP